MRMVNSSPTRPVPTSIVARTPTHCPSARRGLIVEPSVTGWSAESSVPEPSVSKWSETRAAGAETSAEAMV